MPRVMVLGDIDAFRRIVASALRASGIDAMDVAIGAGTLTLLASEHPDVVIFHPPQGVFAAAYLERVSQVTQGARVFVITESSTVTTTPEGTVRYVSRRQVRELVEAVRALTVLPAAV